jgi:serine/threonine protein phosphatase PrpC
VEVEAGPVVAVSDRGRRHQHNEDAVAVGVGPDGAAVLVVCDGVSSTAGSAAASLAAADAARDVLVAGLEQPQLSLDGSAETIESLLTRAAAAAQHQAVDSFEFAPAAELAEAAVGAPVGEVDPRFDDGGAPSTTLVAVVARPQPDDRTELAACWVGDSRAYWVGTGGDQVGIEGDQVGADQVGAEGDQVGAEGDRRLTGPDHELAGSLVRWLGADCPEPEPDVAVSVAVGPGHLVVCSDGLWRYAAEPGELGATCRRLLGEGYSGRELASALVEFANGEGGHDNISVALWSSEPGASPGPTGPVERSGT